MNDNAVALSFISNIGLKNLRNKDVVKLVQEYLNDIESKIDDTLNIAASTSFKLDSTSLNTVNYNIKKQTDVYSENDVTISKQSSIQVQLLEHMILLRNEECLNSLDDVKTKSFLSLSKSMLLDVKNKSSWHRFIDDTADKEATEISWDYIPSLVSILIISMKLEDYLKLNESIVFPLLLNNILYSFRYMFQSETSNLCVIDHPEWAISYIKDIIKRYTPVFRRIKRELKTEEKMHFDAFMDGTNLEDGKREELFNEFSKLCKESANVDYLSKWCHLLATELRQFVYSRLPLLVYDYYKMPHEKLVKLSELTEVISMKNVIDLRATRSFFEDVIKINVLYTMMNSLVDLATFLRPMSTVSSYELFSDFDCNTPIPYIKLDYGDGGSEQNEISFEYESKYIYGAMDALISLESIYTMNVLKQLLNDEGIYDSISYKNLTQAAVYLQDDKYSSQISSIIISLLKSIDDRCRCLNFIESRSKYTIEIVVPIITYYIDSLKYKWNSIGDILESCSLACFLLESSNVLYGFLLKYPESQFMSSTITTLDGIINKMVTIIGQYVVDLIYEPFKHIHETTLDVIDVLTHKLLEMSALCTQKTHDKIVKQTMEAIEATLISVLIPNKRHDYIIYNENHIDIIIQNCFYISNTLKSNIDHNKCASCIELVEDFLTLLQLETIELKMISEYLDVLSATKLCSINATSDSNEHLATLGGNSNTLSSIHSSDGTAIYTDLLDSDDDSSRNQNTSNDSLITEQIRRKLKVKKLDLTKIYTFVMHILNGISREFPPDS